jgi:diadenosine tetraphosphate (Ap4A) HIT family hydrolase
MNKLFPNEVILETKHFTIAQDWEVPIVGFYVLSSKRKVTSILEFNDDEAFEYGHLIRKVRQAMNDVLGITNVYFFQNEDSQHGFHLWIFPRHIWMARFGLKIQSVRPIMDYAQENMATDEVIQEVKGAALKMRDFLSF